MLITCPFCKEVFEAAAKHLKMQGTQYNYYSCPVCTKPVHIAIAMASPPPVAANGPVAELVSTPAGTGTLGPVPGWLVVSVPPSPPQRLPLKVGENVVGRRSVQSPADVLIETADTAMSRRHCLIEVVPDVLRGRYTFQVRDMNSTNGTYLGDQAHSKRLTETDVVYLSDGEKLLLGGTSVVLEVNQSAGFAPKHKVSDTVVLK